MRKTFKYRIYPSKQQVAQLERTLEVCRILYNSCLVDRRNHYEQTGKGLIRIRQQEILKADKARVSCLKEVHSQVLQDVLFRVERAFDGFFRRLKESGVKAGYPRFKSEGRYDSITYPQQPGFRIIDGKLVISKIGALKIRMHRTIQGQVKTCSVVRDGAHWYACFSAEYEPEKKAIPSAEIGIDVGLKSFATLSDGSEIENPKHFRKAEKQLAKAQRKLSKKKIGSKNRKMARKKVSAVHRKVRNQRNDFQHKESRILVNSFGMIVAEDLKIRNMVRNPYLSKSISDAGWGSFLNKLAYKAEEAGCWFEKVPPHNTSVECSDCGTKVSKTLATRTHRCPSCGLVIDRDHNAALNILSRAGTARSHARGESSDGGTARKSRSTSHGSLKQEAPSLAAG